MRQEDLYPALVGLSVLVVLAGATVLLAPRLTPDPLASAVRPLGDLWLVGVLGSGIGGVLLALLALRSLQ